MNYFPEKKKNIRKVVVELIYLVKVTREFFNAHEPNTQYGLKLTREVADDQIYLYFSDVGKFILNALQHILPDIIMLYIIL